MVESADMPVKDEDDFELPMDTEDYVDINDSYEEIGQEENSDIIDMDDNILPMGDEETQIYEENEDITTEPEIEDKNYEENNELIKENDGEQEYKEEDLGIKFLFDESSSLFFLNNDLYLVSNACIIA